MGSSLSQSLQARSRPSPGQVSQARVTSRARPPRSHFCAKLSLDRSQMRKRVTRRRCSRSLRVYGGVLFLTLSSLEQFRFRESLNATHGSAFLRLQRTTSTSTGFPLDESQNSSHNIRPLTGNLRHMEELMKIGYVRVSKQEQHETVQIDALKQAGCVTWVGEKR